MTALQGQSPVQKPLTAIHVRKWQEQSITKQQQKTKHFIFLNVPEWQLQNSILQTNEHFIHSDLT
jgi:hypothetical protein